MSILPEFNTTFMLTLLFGIAFSGFLLALGYLIYYYLHKRHQKGRTTDPRDVAVEEAVKIVDEARNKAMTLLQQANLEAKNIFEGSEDIKSETKQLFNQKMQQISQTQMQAFDSLSQDLLNSYKMVLSQEKEESLKSFVDISDALKQQMTAEVRAFAQNMKQATQDTENTIRQDMKAQTDQVTSQMSGLANNLAKITAEAEESLKGNLGAQYGKVQGEIDGLAEKLRAVTQETENKIKQELGQEYEQARQAVHEFADRLKQATIETENTLKQDVKSEYDQIKKDLQDYRKDRMQKIDHAVTGMMEEVARDVLGKTMNAKDHEELIIRSLEGIKRTTKLKEL